MDTIKKLLAGGLGDLWESKKARMAGAAALLLMLVAACPAMPVEVKTILMGAVAAIGGTYLVGQGIADSGKEAAKILEKGTMKRAKAEMQERDEDRERMEGRDE